MKKIIAIVLMAAAVICCTACGLDMSKIKGEWTLSSVGGKPVEQIAEEQGVLPVQVAMNGTVTDDSFTVANAVNTSTYKIQVKSNGFECLDDSNAIAFSVTYDKDSDALSFALDAGSGAVTYVMKRGTADLTIPDDIGSTAESDGGEYSAEEYYTGEAE